MKNKFSKLIKKIFFAGLLLTICSGNINNQVHSGYTGNRAAAETMLPLEDTLERAGFSSFGDGDRVFFKKGGLTLQLDLSLMSVKKGDFTYYLSKSGKEIEGCIYVEKETIEKMINQRIIINNEEILFENYEYEPHMWTNLSGSLVAHACGGINGISGDNSLEALITSYNNYHTVFEIDLRLTSDNHIVAVHDWERYKRVMAHEEFMRTKIADVFTTMDIDDIFGAMALNKEIYLVTDTKSYDDNEEEIVKQFTILRDKAEGYDGELLKRIVPQIYNQEMYWIINKVYPFESIIYTLYASPDTDAQVVEFVRDKEEIKVITMGPARFSDKFCAELTENGKLIYLFTLNDLNEAKGYLKRGVHGIYTDFIYPRDM